ncbi:MAG: aquaporin [Phycisphaerales bacterium]
MTLRAAHINPAVTIAFWVSGRFKGKRVPGYVVAQLIGALLAAPTARVMFPTKHQDAS